HLVALVLQLAWVVPRPHRAADGADADIPTPPAVPVLGIVRDGEPAAAAGNVDPRLPGLLVAAGMPLDRAVRHLERRLFGLHRRRVAQLQQRELLAPVDRYAHVDVGRVRGDDVVLAQRRVAVPALYADDRTHRPVLEQAHRLALELTRLVVVRDDAVAPRVGAVVDHDGMPLARRRQIDACRLEHELRDPSGAYVELE